MNYTTQPYYFDTETDYKRNIIIYTGWIFFGISMLRYCYVRKNRYLDYIHSRNFYDNFH